MGILMISGDVFCVVDDVDIEQFKIESPAEAAHMTDTMCACAAALRQAEMISLRRQLNGNGYTLLWKESFRVNARDVEVRFTIVAANFSYGGNDIREAGAA